MSDSGDLIGSVKDWVRKSKAVDIAQKVDALGHSLARGGSPWTKSANLDMPKLAQEQANRSLGKKTPVTSPMTPQKKVSR